MAGQAALQLAVIQVKQLDQEKKEMKEGDPTNLMEELSEIYPLFEDQKPVRGTLLPLKQTGRDRLNSLKNQENPDDPAIKVRMRELESEQRKTREEMENLLNDIETHARRLAVGQRAACRTSQSSLSEFVEAVRMRAGSDNVRCGTV